MECVYELLTLLYQKRQEDNIFVVWRKQKLAGQAGDCQAKLSAFASPYRNVENLKRLCSFCQYC